jgi:hypothetical protein
VKRNAEWFYALRFTRYALSTEAPWLLSNAHKKGGGVRFWGKPQILF